MPLSRSARHALLIGALLAPSLASAGVVVITPLVPARGVSASQVADILALMSSELEFMADVDEVVEVDPAPTALTVTCLDSTRCLGTIAKDHNGDMLLTGAVDDAGDDLVIDVLLYERAANRVVRRKTFTIPSSAAEMVDALPAVVKETITGVSPEARKKEEMGGLDFGSDLASDDMAFEDDGRAAVPVAPPPSRPSSTTTTTGSSSARAVDRTIVAPPPPPPPPKPAEEDAFDPNAFSFGDSAEDISFGTTPADVTTSAPPPAPPPRPPPPIEEDEEIYDPYDPDVVDMDSEDFDRSPSTDRRRYESSPSASSTQRRTDAKKPSAEEYRRVYITARAGYANYGLFHFGSGGGEAQVRVAGGFSLLAGVDGWFVTRELPPDLQQSSGRRTITQTIVPIHVGFIYRIKPGKFQPYVGADGIVAQYYTRCFNPSTQQYADCPATGGERAAQGLVVQRSVAGGARARIGFDYMITRNFGLNVDAALGFWLGNDWPLVDQRLPTLAFLPYVGGGITVAF